MNDTTADQLIAATVTDHVGQTVPSGLSDCDIADADTVLERTVTFSATQSWTVAIGQCPSFTAAYLASSSTRCECS